ncbi:MAG: phosphatidylglycerol lysyltransferase domain-containing protein [Candidatus Omnitrophota bacterium]
MKVDSAVKPSASPRGEPQNDNVIIIKIFFLKMKLNSLILKDKKLFNDFLRLNRHGLSVYAFENIFIWNRLYDILWRVIDGNLCVFFKDKIGCFLYLAPLGKKISVQAVEEAFVIMNGYNRNEDISRVENIEEKDVDLFEAWGYKCSVKSHDYVCTRDSLVDLRGDRFKSKRACCNYFIKNNKFECFDFSLKYGKECLVLYDLWQGQRKSKTDDKLYQAMLEDSKVCLENLLDNYKGLDVIGKIVKVKNPPCPPFVKGGESRLAAFSFGYELNPDTFCILYEITDISVKGLAQFIFREFISSLKEYKYINIMDDSGLENLKEVKLSYHPEKLVPAYIAVRGK